MPNPGVPVSELRRTFRAVAEEIKKGEVRSPANNNVIEPHTRAADALGMPPATVRGHLRIGLRLYGWTPEDFLTPVFELEDEDGDDVNELLERLSRENGRYIEKVRKQREHIVPVRPEPFGIAFIGDPHLDNKGTNIQALQDDLELIRASGMRAVNMGDLLDSFQATKGLADKQSHNPVTIKQAYLLAEWFMTGTGVRFDMHLAGNHDHWPGDGFEGLMKVWARKAGSRVSNWSAKIHYTWGDGEKFTVHASHDFKGNSLHNDLHGPMRRAKEDGTADLYVAGHRHTSGQGSGENGFRGRHYHFLRVRGYKDEDDYAFVKGFPMQEAGRSAVAVINPLAETQEGRCRTFLDVAEGAMWLQALRGASD